MKTPMKPNDLPATLRSEMDYLPKGNEDSILILFVHKREQMSEMDYLPKGNEDPLVHSEFSVYS